MSSCNTKRPATKVVSDEISRQVYDSPQSLPGKYTWVTTDEDVRKIEQLLGMDPKTIGAPRVSGDSRNCPDCGRETNWLDIISLGLASVHDRKIIAKVILGDRKFVNIEAPRAIADLSCFQCGRAIIDLRSFKCHNWAYASPALLEVLERMPARERQ